MKNYNVVCFSISGHEAGITMIRNGEVHEMVLEERLSGKKHDNSLLCVFDPVLKFHEPVSYTHLTLPTICSV